MKYDNWLRNIKGYSETTIYIYMKYKIELEKNDFKYDLMIEKYGEKSNSTKRLVLSAIKSYYVFANDKRSSEIILPKRNVSSMTHVTYEQYKDYISAINKNTKMGFQKYLIVKILFETGIRASELLNISKSDIRDNQIKINGKGNKQRIILISKWLQNDLEYYLKNHDMKKLFNFGYKNLYEKIKILDKTRTLSPHMFRRGFAKYCNNNKISIYDISIAMGHSSIDTTAEYINKKSEDVSIYKIF